MNSLVSVVVPVYKVEKYLDRCINSIVSQTYKNLEIILVDDGSPDNCPVMCDEWAKKDNRIKVIHKLNEGLGLARNSGIEIATGKYITFVDSDDYIAKEAYEYGVALLERTNSDCCIASYIDRKNTGKEIRRINPLGDSVYDESEIYDNVLLGILGAEPEYEIDTYVGMSVWKCIYLNEIIKNSGLKFPSEREYISEDIIFQLSIFPYLKRICTSTYPYYYYCENDSFSLTKNYSEDKFYKYEKLFRKEMEMLEELGQLENGKFRVARTFLGNIRVCIKQICENSDLKAKDKRRAIRKIADNRTFREVISWYPWRKNPVKQRIFTYLLKSKKIVVLMTILGK